VIYIPRFVYGLVYLTLTTLPLLFQDIYHQSGGMAGLHYIALGLGYTVAAQINAFSMDRLYAYLKKRNLSQGKPEYRLPIMVPGSMIMPLSLLVMG
jgi:hypothetical protein